MGNKMTAVEWVFDKMLDIAAGNSSLTTQEILEKGREMEREQQRLIYEGLLQNVGTSIKQSDLPTFEQYYNETYKGGEQ